MSQRQRHSPVHIKLSQEQQAQLLDAVQAHFATELDEEISYFKAKSLLAFFVAELGPLVYNQAIQDAHQFVQDKLAELEPTLYEPEAF
ncbi:MAG: DUF2164 domain-containing protein [Leptolyngbya sp. SIO4C5]|uniref:DUF2164 domain-containing protein n=1 Tax=Sphaerothrix gracilis TaxID=3151835 RepID=UPI0013BEC0BA|nr:DUF2164 domain-containing protein [Leptolyngbya sp. SIO4C5]